MPKYWHLIYVKLQYIRSEYTKMFFLNASLKKTMFYSFELQMAGVILLTAMAVCGISLWIKRRKLEKESVEQESAESIEQDISENK